MVFSFLQRAYYSTISPPLVPKTENPLRFGILGASKIAPQCVILPARSHPDVCIYGVAARDKTRAKAYADHYDIPRTYAIYRELIEDPCIDVVYIALPNSHHYEWAHAALQAGKHVLLEKPSTSNSAEAQALLSRPGSHTPLSPVILEAFHYRFHPAWQKFLSLVHDPQLGASVVQVECNSYLWRGAFPQDDIRFSLALSGGCVMDFATYCLSCVRDVTRDPSPVVESVKFRTQDTAQGGSDQIDEAVWIKLRSASGAEVSIEADMAKKGDLPFLPATWCQNWPSFGWPKCVVKLSEMPVDGQQDGAQIGETHCIQRTVTLWNLVFLHLWHTIEVSDQHVIRKESQVIRTWEVKKTIKAYEPPGESKSRNPGCELWSTYRYQLEAFVNKVRGHEGTDVWISGEDSIAQMKLIDQVYTKGGLTVRPSRTGISQA